MVQPLSNFSLKFIICTILLSLQSLYSAAQIGNVLVTVPPAGYFCTGDNFTITFDIKNSGKTTDFTANSQYTLEIGTLSGQTFTPIPNKDINSLKYTGPIPGKNVIATIEFPLPQALPSAVPANAPITIPTIASNPAYVIAVSSINPADDKSNKRYSAPFEVVETPVTIAANDGPYCVTADINLTSNLTLTPDPQSTAVPKLPNTTNVTYAWTGPNSYTSTLANPVIATVDTSMSGTYYLTTTNTSTTTPSYTCSSVQSSTIVVVSNDITWTGAGVTNDWNLATNWSCGFLPRSTSNVIIPAGLSTYPVLGTGSGICNNIAVALSASLEISNNTLQVNGSITSTNGINLQAGTLDFTGINAQTIPANSFLNNTIKDLTITNTAGVTNSGILNITGILTTNGGFNTGGTLTLISDAVQTALIDGSGSGTITGDVTMQRLIDPAFGYKLISAPLQGVTVGAFAPVLDPSATFEDFYTYDENRVISVMVGATGYIPYIDPAGVLGVFKGYAVNFGGTNSPKTIEVTGTVTNGPQSISLSNNNGTYTKGFNLVGNPYPSPIDWAAGGWTKTKVDNALYFFTTSGTDPHTGSYTSAVNGLGGPSVIPSMQGFFVHVTDGTYPVSAVLSSTNAVRVNNFSNEFVKSPEEQKKTITLSAKFDDSNLKDDLLFYFDRSASKGFDSRLDALKLMNTDPSVPNLYCLTNTKQTISINAIPNIIGGTETVIPLGISTAVNNWINISLNDLPYDLASNYIYLIDLDENKVIDLQQKSTYRFFGNAGKNESRFELRISNTPISIDEVIFDEIFSLDNSNGTVKVKMNLNPGEVGDIKVASLTGQILDTHFVANKDVVEITGIKSTGLYIISFYTTNGVFSKKVIIKN